MEPLSGFVLRKACWVLVQLGGLNGRADGLPPAELRTGVLLHYPGNLQDLESSLNRKGWWHTSVMKPCGARALHPVA